MAEQHLTLGRPSLLPGLSGDIVSTEGLEKLLEDYASPRRRTTGIFPSQDLRSFIDAGLIRADQQILDTQIQPASLDLRLGSVAYEVRASFLPSKSSRVMDRVASLLVKELPLSRPATLERNKVYIVPVLEQLHLPPGVVGRANPKSTIGRLDVFTRLITDFGMEFERVGAGHKGGLYVEVAPRSFSVVVHEGSTLNQVRLMQGPSPTWSGARLRALDRKESLTFSGDEPRRPFISRGLWLSIDLEGEGPGEIIGYKAKHDTPPIDLDRVQHYDPGEYWEFIRPQGREVILEPGDFYILASKERVSIPPSVAAEMIGYDSSVGEFRIHYAGFFDPGFGYDAQQRRGSKAVLEVRSHEVPFLLVHGQRVARLVFEPLLAPPQKVYGTQIGSSYQGQSLSLSKQFRS